MNLLEETLSAIEQSGHKPSDIIFIGSEVSGHSCTWKEFERLAGQEHRDGICVRTVANDLIIVFSDGQRMWRNGYDKIDWWEYFKPFEPPEESRSIQTLFGSTMYHESLSEIHEKEV